MNERKSGEQCSQTDRYSRQTAFAPLGEAGQQRLQQGRALVVGCGALGGTIATILVRAGVGRDGGCVALIDPDTVRLSNLHRQTSFTEDDVRCNRFKVEAARKALSAADEKANIETIAVRFDENNAEMVADFDILIDATDDFSTRFLMNRAAVKYRKPFVTAGVAGASGQILTVLPGETACLECFLDPKDNSATVVVPVLPPLPQLFAALEAMEAIKILSGHAETVDRSLFAVDLWENRFRRFDLKRNENCPVCGNDRLTVGRSTELSR